MLTKIWPNEAYKWSNRDKDYYELKVKMWPNEAYKWSNRDKDYEYVEVLIMTSKELL